MTDRLKLDLPFYLPEAVETFVLPLLSDAATARLSVAALEQPAVCEALNEALKFSIERST